MATISSLRLARVDDVWEVEPLSLKNHIAARYGFRPESIELQEASCVDTELLWEPFHKPLAVIFTAEGYGYQIWHDGRISRATEYDETEEGE